MVFVTKEAASVLPCGAINELRCASTINVEEMDPLAVGINGHVPQKTGHIQQRLDESAFGPSTHILVLFDVEKGEIAEFGKEKMLTLVDAKRTSVDHILMLANSGGPV